MGSVDLNDYQEQEDRENRERFGLTSSEASEFLALPEGEQQEALARDPRFSRAAELRHVEEEKREEALRHVEQALVEAARRTQSMRALDDFIKRVTADVSALMSKFELPKIELPKLPKIELPKINAPALDAVTRQMAESVMTGFDFSKLLPKIDFGKYAPAGGWEQWWANWWPPNWPRDTDLAAAQAILNDEALPLVWVPRADIVAEVMAAQTREERVAVLVARRSEVAEDCRAVLADVDHPRLRSQRRLLAAAVEALAEGHDEAAQSLAVLVTETAVLQAGAAGYIDGIAKHVKLYERVRDAVRVNLDEGPLWLLRVAGALAPVAGFFTPFYPHKGDQVPEGMSRHVTVHFAFDEHYTEEHAVVAVLLMTSVVRGLEQGWKHWEPAEENEVLPPAAATDG